MKLKVGLLLAAISMQSVLSCNHHGDGHARHHDHEDHRRRLGKDLFAKNGGPPEGKGPNGGGGSPDGKGPPFTVGQHTFADFEDFKSSGRRCGSPEPSEREKKDMAAVVQAWLAERGLGRGRDNNPGVGRNDKRPSVGQGHSRRKKYKKQGNLRRALQAPYSPINIDVYFHVIKNGSSGDLPVSAINSQISVLNAAFASATSSAPSFQFTLQGITRSDNAAWYAGGDSIESPMKNALYVGEYTDANGATKLDLTTLNISSTSSSDGTLGYAYLPGSNVGKLDGVVILDTSLPGGSSAPYNEGDTLTHEVRMHITPSGTISLLLDSSNLSCFT